MEDHEYSISDNFLSWGWTKIKTKLYFWCFKLFQKQIKRNQVSKKILLILTALPKYSYMLFSVPISASQVFNYHYDQFKFLIH